MRMHGGSPRVRRRENGNEQGSIEINHELLANKAIDAALTAGVSLAVAQMIKD